MRTVLIVDDEAALVRSIATYLQSFGDDLEVLTATSGEEGLQILTAHHVDVLLTDVSMPGLDGIALVRHAVDLRPGIRVIVMTAFGTPELEALALREGAMRFVDKPVDLEELRNLIQLSAMAESGWAGMVGGLDILDVAQLITLSGATAVVHVGCGSESGVLVFRDRSVVHASTGATQGEAAFFEMALWDGGTFQEVLTADVRGYPSNIGMRANHLFMEAARRRDEVFGRRAGRGAVAGSLDEALDHALATPVQPLDGGAECPAPGPEARERLGELLAELAGEHGCLGAVVLLPGGEHVGWYAEGQADLCELLRTAGDSLQALTTLGRRLGIGRTDLALLRSARATCAVRWLDGRTGRGAATCRLVLLARPDAPAAAAERLADTLGERVIAVLRESAPET
ncbi:MAG TPA: response regulator [Thermoanaerobaculaceae bacterium]|nr:response regulator [Thermoanaerobaculaceae bacterium]HRS17577.1 response regulator [Thermoanaerobaculaceae bacterium]